MTWDDTVPAGGGWHSDSAAAGVPQAVRRHGLERHRDLSGTLSCGDACPGHRGKGQPYYMTRFDCCVGYAVAPEAASGAGLNGVLPNFAANAPDCTQALLPASA